MEKDITIFFESLITGYKTLVRILDNILTISLYFIFKLISLISRNIYLGLEVYRTNNLYTFLDDREPARIIGQEKEKLLIKAQFEPKFNEEELTKMYLSLSNEEKKDYKIIMDKYDISRNMAYKVLRYGDKIKP